MDSGYVDPIQHNSEVNTSTSGVAASNPAEMEMISHVDEARATGGASFEPSLTQVSSDLPPLTTDASDRPSLTTDDHLYVEEEVSGVSHTKVVDDMGILSFEVVRVDLAELENARGMAMVVEHPLFHSLNNVWQVVEVSEALQEGEYCSFEDRDCSSPKYCSPLAVILPGECSNTVVVSDERRGVFPMGEKPL